MFLEVSFLCVQVTSILYRQEAKIWSKRFVVAINSLDSARKTWNSFMNVTCSDIETFTMIKNTTIETACSSGVSQESIKIPVFMFKRKRIRKISVTIIQIGR